MTGNQGLGKLQPHTLVPIIRSKLFTAPYSSSVSLLEDEGAPRLYSCRFGGSLVSLCDSPKLSLCSKDSNTYLKSAKSPFFSPQQQSWGLAFHLGSELKE